MLNWTLCDAYRNTITQHFTIGNGVLPTQRNDNAHTVVQQPLHT